VLYRIIRDEHCPKESLRENAPVVLTNQAPNRELALRRLRHRYSYRGDEAQRLRLLVALTGILLGIFLSAHCVAVRSPNSQARTVRQQFYELTPIEIPGRTGASAQGFIYGSPSEPSPLEGKLGGELVG
jgi:hypothetical protein